MLSVTVFVTGSPHRATGWRKPQRNGDSMTDETTATPAVSGDAATPAPVVTTDATPPTGPKPDAAPPATAEPKRKPDYRHQKIAELSYQNRELERRLDRVLGIVESQTRTRGQTDDPMPRIEDFKDKTLDEYLDARDTWRERQRTKEKPAEPQKDGGQAEYERRISAAREDLITAGSEKYEDFEDLISSPGLKISAPMRDAIFELDDAEIQVEVSYFLAKNPKEALRISRLSPIRQVAEIGKLEAKVSSQPVPKRPSAAPAPISPVGGANTPNDEIQPQEDYKSFLRKRNRQLGRK